MTSWAAPGLSPTQVAFLTGAGISADGPTNGPVGLELTRRALTYAYWPGTEGELRKAYRAVAPNPLREVPRLEAVLEIAVQAHGISVLAALLSDLAAPVPNALHEFFALHVDAGGTHITANFDTAIDDLTESRRILHFHGALDGLSPYAAIGATLSRIERGFDDHTRHRLKQAILLSHIRELLVIGYSGLDFFDMDPFIVDIAPAMASNGIRVVWVDHDGSAQPEQAQVTSTPDMHWAPMLRALQRAGVECLRVRCQTADVLKHYARDFGFPSIEPLARGQTRWSQPLPLIDANRLDATRRLYLHLGLHRSLDRLIATHPVLATSMSPNELAEMAWQIGDHRKAVRHWRRSFAGSAPVMHARRLEREAACLWDRGSYLRAYTLARMALSLAREAKDSTVTSICLETLARILNHMRRTPDLRWFVTTRRVADLLDEISVNLEDSTLSLHIRTRLRDAAGLLAADPETFGGRIVIPATPTFSSAEGAEIFNQYESLSALLDYRRGSQRRDRASDGQPMQILWLQTYLAGTRFLGKTAAETTAPALPGASCHFTFVGAIRSLASAPATAWHKGRLLGRYLLDRHVSINRYSR